METTISFEIEREGDATRVRKGRYDDGAARRTATLSKLRGGDRNQGQEKEEKIGLARECERRRASGESSSKRTEDA